MTAWRSGVLRKEVSCVALSAILPWYKSTGIAEKVTEMPNTDVKKTADTPSSGDLVYSTV